MCKRNSNTGPDQTLPPPFSEIFNVINGEHPSLKSHTAEVRDSRQSSKNGFQVVEHELPGSPADLDFFDTPTVAARYWPDLLAMVKSRLGARSVVVIDTAVRQSSNEAHSEADRRGRLRGASTQEAHRAGKPFHIVHNDVSADGCSWIYAEDDAIRESRCESYTQWDGTRYRGPRLAALSVWRPLETVTSDATSMFATPSTFDERHAAYASIQIPHHDRPGFANYQGNDVMPMLPMLPGAGRQHRWYWIKVTFIKLFDSEAWLEGSRVMPFSAHSAVRVPGQRDSAPRLSVETRALVIGCR